MRSATGQVRRCRALPVALHLRVDPLGGPAQRQLAQGDQVALAEEAVDRPRRLLGHVDLALAQALEQLLGRQVDQLDLVGVLEERVGHGLAHGDAGDLLDDVVEALEVLDVERGVDVDAGVEQLLDVLPALGVARAGGVGVGQLVDQEHRRLAGEGGVEVELAQRDAAVLDAARRQDLQPSSSASVSVRPWVSTTPTTTSTPRRCSSRAASSMA